MALNGADVVEFFRIVEEGQLQNLKKLISEWNIPVDITNQVVNGISLWAYQIR